MNDIRNIIILGSGPAGLTAGIYAARARLNPLIIAGLNFGGQLMNTTQVDNFPGFPQGILGPELMKNMIQQAEKFDIEIIYEDVTDVDFNKKIKTVWIGKKKFLAKSIIISTGANPSRLGLESEKKYYGKGVSYCATCDGPFFRDKVICVVGGGDSAGEKAIFLTKFAKKVYLIVRRDQLRACKIIQAKVLNNNKIEVLWNTRIIEILGDGNIVTGIITENAHNQSKKTIQLNGVFVAIGHVSNTNYLKNEIELDEKGYIKVKDYTKTNVKGVFVAGDVNNTRYRQAVIAAGFGAMAALDAERYLEPET